MATTGTTTGASPTANKLYQQYMQQWYKKYGNPPYTDPQSGQKQLPMTFAQWLVVAKQQKIVSADGSIPGQHTTHQKHHSAAGPATKKSKTMYYVGGGLLLIGVAALIYASVHKKKAE